MPLLRPVIVLMLFAGIVSCAPGGAVTPREAFMQLRAAYLRSDTDALAQCLSKSSMDQFTRAMKLMGTMEEKRRDAVADLYGIPRQNLAKCTLKDVLDMHFKQEKLTPSVSRAVRFDIVDIERKHGRARVKVQNGMELMFVKEGPYWKFDLSAY